MNKDDKLNDVSEELKTGIWAHCQVFNNVGEEIRKDGVKVAHIFTIGETLISLGKLNIKLINILTAQINK